MDKEEELAMAQLLLEPLELVEVLVEMTLSDSDIFDYNDLILYQLDCTLEYK